MLKASMEKKRSTRPKYGPVKLSVTVKRRLERKYKKNSDALKQINTEIQNWIKADARRGVQTVHVEVDNSKDEEMRKRRVRPVSGRVTPLKVKRVIDDLWKRLRPKYLVLFGGDDIVPMFKVRNPTHYWRTGVTDWDRMLPTDNPYATRKPFDPRDIDSYLVPDRVIGRIPDIKSIKDPAWLVDYLKTATKWKSRRAGIYKKTYAICTSESSGAGRECMQFISKPASELLISPPTRDTSTSARNRLSARLHLIKCHGIRLDANFWGKGKRFVRAIKSTTLKACLKPATLVGATCCWGAQIFSPNARHARRGRWPLASIYLRKGAFAFLGPTARAWFGGPTMGFADYIVADYLKWILRHASIGRAFLESKHEYMCNYLEGGGTPDPLDQKTLIEYVLLGDPSIHPVRKKVSRPENVLDDQERAQRRVVHVRRAREIRKLLPKRAPATPRDRARAKDVFNSAQRALGKHVSKELAKFEIKPAAARVAKLETRLGIQNRQSLDYYWGGRRFRGKQTQSCVMRAETDLEGNLYRAYVGYSS
jgi:Peptidase family C25